MDVSIPVYVYRKYEKMNPHLLHLTEVLIGRDKLKLVWVDKEVYDETRGLYFPKIKIEEPTFEVNMNITGTHFLLLSRLQAKAATLCGRYYDDAYFRKQDHTRNKTN